MIHCILLSIFGYMASDCFILASWGHINGFPLSDNSYILSAFYAKIVSFHPVQLEVIFSLFSFEGFGKSFIASHCWLTS